MSKQLIKNMPNKKTPYESGAFTSHRKLSFQIVNLFGLKKLPKKVLTPKQKTCESQSRCSMWKRNLNLEVITT